MLDRSHRTRSVRAVAHATHSWHHQYSVICLLCPGIAVGRIYYITIGGGITYLDKAATRMGEFCLVYSLVEPRLFSGEAKVWLHNV